MSEAEEPGGLQAALPREMYVDPATFAVERDRVLFAEWFCVGRRVDLGLADSGRIAVVDVVGESVIVTTDAAGALHAAYNVCRHRGSQLVASLPGAEPVCSAAGSLRCPYHSWTYALDGSLLKAPHADVSVADRWAFSLNPVEVGEWAGFVFVHLGSASTSLAAAMARPARTLAHYRMADLATGLRFTYEVAANYKVVAENYNECYHCGPVHPELTRLVPAFGGGGTDIDWDHGVPHRDGAWTYTVSGTTTRAHPPQG
jgi:Rieske 2Fe-2S family protein